MIKEIGTFLSVVTLLLAAGTALAGSEEDVAPVKADLNAVVEAGTVASKAKLVTAGQPDREALEVFAADGFTTVIDLRGATENRGLDEASVVDSLGMDYINFEITDRNAISLDNARQLSELIAAAPGPVLLHCGSANRVGALLALGKSLEGASDSEALDYGKSAGLRSLESRVVEVLEESND